MLYRFYLVTLFSGGPDLTYFFQLGFRRFFQIYIPSYCFRMPLRHLTNGLIHLGFSPLPLQQSCFHYNTLVVIDFFLSAN